MKSIQAIYGLMAAATLTLGSCSINDLPEFTDKDAFVAFTSSSVSVAENVESGSVELSVMLTSLNGLDGTVDFQISAPETAGAVEGTHFTVEGTSRTLTFTKEQSTQTIKLNIIDNDVFGGDVKLVVTLVNPQGVNLGADKTCTVTIVDNEHPLAFILGDFNCVGYDYFSDGAEETWVATIEKDATDVNKVWIKNICSGGCSAAYPVYGIVNDEKTEIRIPVDQTTSVTASYDGLLEGWNEDGSVKLTDAITGTISPDGTITIKDWFGAHAYASGSTTSAGWYAIEMGAVFKKQ